jgi:ADP-L-glycero-D-manno-heptose 6-epimerase
MQVPKAHGIKPSMAKILVTGGAGFIGSNLVWALDALGHDIVVADRGMATAETSLRGFTGDILPLDVSRPFKFPHDFEVVFHQAALTDPRFDDDKEIFRQNVEGFERILAYCIEHGCRLIYASTAGLYGNGPIPMKEDQAKDLLTAYGKSKLAMDEIAERHFDQLPLIGLRYFNAFGPRESHKGRPASMIFHLGNQMRQGARPRLFTAGEHRRDFVYVKDIVKANLCALTAPSGVYNVGTGVGTSFNELVVVLNEVLGTSFEPEYFDMPYDPATYQHHTVADTHWAKKQLKFSAEWNLKDAVRDYFKWLYP